MHYVSAEGLEKSFGITPLFSDITFHISEGDKIALIARNGVGKSTLLRILAGRETPDEGKLWINKHVRVALFEQEPVFREEASVLENIFHLDNPIIPVLKEYEAAVQGGDAGRITEAIEKMDEAGAWDFEARVRTILGKLEINDLAAGVATLSGGQRKRVALARTLIDIGFDPGHTLLMMDEPTNHLDVEMVEWLENYLGQERVTLVLVTHDRYFLDAVCEKIWELERSKLYSYEEDYAGYLERKAARLESERAGIEKARNEYRRELEWIRKQPKARTTKSKSRIDAFTDVEARAKQQTGEASLQLQVKMSRLGGKILELKKVYKKFGDKSILKGFDYTFSKGERIGIIGRNGVGKTTFLNVIQELESPDSGKINKGETVVYGHFSQQGLSFREDMRVIEYVKSFAESFPLAKGGSLSAAQFLELFLFPPEKQFTYLSSLSGGEKKRLQLLTILFRNPNFLILDEPTNDLDLPTLSVLEAFLSDFAGCVVIVSHDRYFMDRLVDHLFVFEGDGAIRDFPGSYSQYREWLRRQPEEKAAEKREEAAKAEASAPPKPPAKKLTYKEQRELEQLGKEIPLLEEQKRAAVAEMSKAGIAFDELTKLSARIEELTRELDTRENRWLELSILQA